jgi:hypothetical protein
MIEIPTTGGPAGNDIEIKHDFFFNSGNGRVTTRLLGINPDQNIVTMAEAESYKQGNEVYYGYTGLLLPQNDFNLVGYKNGNVVFDNPHNNPYNPPSPPTSGFIGDIIKAAYYLYKLFKDIFFPPTTDTFVTGTIRDLPNGDIEVDIKITTDPIPVDVEIIGGTTYNVDTWGIKKTYTIPAAAGVTINDLTKKRAVVYNFKDIADFDIEDITITPIQIVTL